MCRINREETIVLHNDRDLCCIQEELIDIAEEVAVELASRLKHSRMRWTSAKVKIVVDLEASA